MFAARATCVCSSEAINEHALLQSIAARLRRAVLLDPGKSTDKRGLVVGLQVGGEKGRQFLFVGIL